MPCRCEPWKSDREKTSWRKVCAILRDGKPSMRFARVEVEHQRFGSRWVAVAGGQGLVSIPRMSDFETRQDAQAAGDVWLRRICEAEGGGFSGCGCGRRR